MKSVNYLPHHNTAAVPGGSFKGEAMRQLKTYEFNGKQMTAAQLSRIHGVPKVLIQNRICDGWSVERAVTQPPGLQGHRLKYKPNCDAWGNDCFRCPLSDCNDYRSARKGEVFYVPETVGKEVEYDTRICTAFLDRRRHYA